MGGGGPGAGGGGGGVHCRQCVRVRARAWERVRGHVRTHATPCAYGGVRRRSVRRRVAGFPPDSSRLLPRVTSPSQRRGVASFESSPHGWSGGCWLRRDGGGDLATTDLTTTSVVVTFAIATVAAVVTDATCRHCRVPARAADPRRRPGRRQGAPVRPPPLRQLGLGRRRRRRRREPTRRRRRRLGLRAEGGGRIKETTSHQENGRRHQQPPSSWLLCWLRRPSFFPEAGSRKVLVKATTAD